MGGRGAVVNVLVSAALGALVGLSVLAVVASLRGVQLFPSAHQRLAKMQERNERFSLWLLLAIVAAFAVWAVTGWPVAGAWVFCAALAFPLVSGSSTNPMSDIDKVEAIATWTEQIRDTMNASAGLQQALVATAAHGPVPIAPELQAFARRAPRGDLAAALVQLGDDLEHPSADMVVAGLLAATELDAGRLVPLLSRLAASIRDEARMRVRIEVGRARVRTSMRIVATCVAATILLLVVAGGDLLDGYNSVAGQLWLIVVGGLVVGAVFASRKLSEIPQPERFVARRRFT